MLRAPVKGEILIARLVVPDEVDMGSTEMSITFDSTIGIAAQGRKVNLCVITPLKKVGCFETWKRHGT